MGNFTSDEIELADRAIGRSAFRSYPFLRRSALIARLIRGEMEKRLNRPREAEAETRCRIEIRIGIELEDKSGKDARSIGAEGA